MNNIVEGGCFCGSVRYSFKFDKYPSANCYCSICRRISGAPFVGLQIGFAEVITKMILYFLHEKIWYKFNFDLQGMSYYYVVTESSVGFGSPTVSLFYIIAIALLGYHLKHGIASAGQTLGVVGTKYEKIYNNLSAIFWFWIPLGFISIPVWFGFLVRVI